MKHKWKNLQRVTYEGVPINPLTFLAQLLVNRYGNGSVSSLHYSAGSVNIQLSKDRNDHHLVEVRIQAETDGAYGEQLLLFQVTEKESELVQRVIIDENARQGKKPLDSVYKV